jgi:hypothetical protein
MYSEFQKTEKMLEEVLARKTKLGDWLLMKKVKNLKKKYLKYVV